MNWIPIFGDFTLNDSKIVFNGSIDMKCTDKTGTYII